MSLKSFNHIAIICSDYETSKRFYIEVLGFEELRETYRADRGSYMLDLVGEGGMQIELFTFPDSPARLDSPEGCGLRHLAFTVESIETEVERIESLGVAVEPLRVNEATGKKYTFFKDPDGLPLELCEE